MEFRLLGPLEVSAEGRPIRLGGPKQRTVLAHLLLRPNQRLNADRLIDEVWGEEPPAAARNILQTYVSHLRKALGADRLDGGSRGYLLRVEPSEVDALRFEELLERARELATADPAAAARIYRDALALWGGAALEDLADQVSLRPEISRLEELRITAIEERIDADLAIGRHADLVGELERLVARHPLRERLVGQLMVALYRSGRQAEALDAYRDARRALVEELGIEPGPALRRIEQAILRQDPSVELPEAILRPGAAPPHNLPAQLTSFVGRKREIGEVEGLLARARLVVLTGPGGCGKTRLALRVASEMLPRFADGVFLVSLASLRDPALIVPTIAGTLGLKERPDEPIGETLRRHLASKHVLLVLDNFEHLVDAAPVVTRMLEAAPSVRCLVTSREILRLSGEHEFAVPPLELPDLAGLPPPDLLGELDAVALFVQRARMVDPRFRVTETNAPAVAEICLRLDGLPLAIELAASTIRTFEPQTLLARLEDSLSLLTGGPRDVPARQQTLRDTIAWSYELLREAERRLFRGLGIFLGACTVEAAREVVDPEGPLPIDLQGRLRSLVGKSLVLREPADGDAGRYRMLETIREFARAELGEEGELAELAARHARFFLRTAEEAEPHLLGSEQGAWLDRIESEHDDLRAALRRSIEAGDAETGLRIGASLWRYWLLRGHLREGRGWLELVLSLHGAEEPSPHRVKALTALGGIAYWQADYETAGHAYRETLELCRTLADVPGEAAALSNLGYIAMIEGDLDEARTRFTAARDIHRRLGDRSAYASDGLGLGLVAVRAGEFPTAAEIHEEAIGIFRELGDRFGLGSTLTAVARSYEERGEFDRAEAANREALAIYREAGDLAGIAMALGATADVRVTQSDAETGLRLGGAAHAIEEKIGGGAPGGVRTYRDARELAAGALEPDAIARAWEAGRSLSIDEAAALMLEDPSATP